MKNPGRASLRGALLSEWLIALALTGIMLSASITWAGSWQRQQQARHWTANWVIAMEQLRQHAQQDRQSLAICASTDGSRCQVEWQAKWLVFHDGNGDGIRQRSERVQSLALEIPKAWRMVWRGFRQEAWLTWSAQGDAVLSNGTLTVCPPVVDEAALRQVIVSKSGRMRIRRPSQDTAAVLRAARAVCGWLS
ncbi:MAG: GspH/FimT family protein [Paraperlucidibaca sp.]